MASALLLLALTDCRRAPQPVETTAPAESSIGDPGASTKDMVFIEGGKFLMGTNAGLPYEGPAHEVTVEPFWMDAHEVTVAEFARFVESTGYVTQAEEFGWSGVFDAEAKEWRDTDGANWRHPNGPDSTAAPDEPVTQVSYNDDLAYAEWAEKSLPTEAEWEYAARGRLAGKTYAWGDELRPGGKCVANWWQGSFPDLNTGEDGYTGLAPVARFAPNGFGLYDMAGNVWEWCADWFDKGYYRESTVMNPTGPRTGKERIIRGGSWMCGEDYCAGYRVAARSHATPETALNNLGFRCVLRIPPAPQ